MENNIQHSARINIFKFTAYKQDCGLLVIYLRGKDKDHENLVELLIDRGFELTKITFDQWLNFQANQNKSIKCYLLTDMQSLNEFIKYFKK